MYNLFYFLLCVILIIFLTKLINMDISISQTILARLSGGIEKGNFSYFYIDLEPPYVLNLSSLIGDADIYVSDHHLHPTYDTETYSLHSATCGNEILLIDESFDFPLSVGIYGYAEKSFFVVNIQDFEGAKGPFLSKPVIRFNPTVIKNPTDKVINHDKKAKSRIKTQSKNAPSILSVLEFLQLLFL